MIKFYLLLKVDSYFFFAQYVAVSFTVKNIHVYMWLQAGSYFWAPWSKDPLSKMRLLHYQHPLPTTLPYKRAKVVTKPARTTPKPKEQHEIVKFILKYAHIVWACLEKLPSKGYSESCTFSLRIIIITNNYINMSLLWSSLWSSESSSKSHS